MLRDLGVASVYVRAKLQPAIELRERGLVHHEYRHGLWHGASDGVAGRDRRERVECGLSGYVPHHAIAKDSNPRWGSVRSTGY